MGRILDMEKAIMLGVCLLPNIYVRNWQQMISVWMGNYEEKFKEIVHTQASCSS